ncbi:GTPase [Myxococcota bacterium]|nr:GTPase [Myxococcota bacterium]HOD08502.1 cyclic 2,3-diphosphoglycerate synthase [Myxococcota bacterium]
MAARPRKVIIIGAAGRDFHNFNCMYRNNPAYKVVAFTAAQIPDIAGRKYPAALAGKLYPKGIPIVEERELESLIAKHKVDDVVFSYSDVSHQTVMELGERTIAAGANYILAGSRETELVSKKPVIAVCAIRTGCGKSQTSRYVTEILHKMGLKVAVIRHPMPYGDLAAQAVQRFATYEDMDKHKCTIEEREEYEPHIEAGSILYAGVDYHAILKAAEAEADVILWDGGNNDMPFYKPNLFITVLDPLRPGHELGYYPGMANLLMADVLVINKVDSATPEDLDIVRRSVAKWNPNAPLIEAESVVSLDEKIQLKGKKVLVVEDGPTLTHGGMKIGAGWVVASRAGAEIVEPLKYAVGSIKATYEKYPHCAGILPAMGYSAAQIADLNATVNKVPADLIIVGTPIDLRKLLKDDRKMVRVRYDLKPVRGPKLADFVKKVVG